MGSYSLIMSSYLHKKPHIFMIFCPFLTHIKAPESEHLYTGFCGLREVELNIVGSGIIIKNIIKN